MSFDDWYKNNIEEHREEPPAFVWNEIQNQLDVQDVWSNIAAEFDNREERRIRTWTKWSAAAAVVLLFLGLNLNTSDGVMVTATTDLLPDLNPKYGTSVKANGLVAANTRHELSSEFSLTIKKEMKRASTANQIAALLYENGVHGEKTRTTERSKITTALDPVLAERIYVHTVSRGMQYLSPMDGVETGDEFYKLPLLKRISIGVIGSYNNTWLLSSQEWDELSDADASSISGLGKNIGIITSIDYSEKLCFQMELVHTETSQNYKRAFGNDFSPEELLVNYLNLNILAIHKRNHFIEDYPASHNFIFGAGFGYLTAAKLRDGDVRVDIKEEYTKENVSLSMGYEYEVRPTRRWSIAAGLRTNYGLSNIDRVVYSEFDDNRSNTFSWGGHIMVKYHLGYK